MFSLVLIYSSQIIHSVVHGKTCLFSKKGITDISVLMGSKTNVWAAYKGWKKERLSSSKYLIAKNFMTMFDLTLEAFTSSLLLASGPVRGKSQGQHLGMSSVFCTTAPRLCWSNTAPEARERPLILGNKYRHHFRWISNSKCKSVII